ncbi:uncharacterized protein LOC123636691 isoform X2 [Lemur catta]|uniref:uncharacterized protein LOC123636691 isoform X2 n=1 Tax=Lemur catta TaxID=9447 RepID=UPI001E26BDC3|nr:uncharacterized protein LOC123636691 isoform X2 [Lemur catta]
MVHLPPVFKVYGEKIKNATRLVNLKFPPHPPQFGIVCGISKPFYSSERRDEENGEFDQSATRLGISTYQEDSCFSSFCGLQLSRQ